MTDYEGLTSVPNYGIHQANGMAFIHERLDGKGRDLSTGVSSPFIVDMGKKAQPRCPHSYPYPYADESVLAQIKLKTIFGNNKIIQAMLPRVNPSPVVAYVGHEYPYATFHIFQRLSQMAHPINDNSVRAFTKGDQKRLFEEARLTNILPLVLVGFNTKDTNVLHEMIQLAHLGYRNVIFVGAPDIPLAGGVANYTKDLPDAERFVDVNYNVDLKAVGSAIMVREALSYAQTFAS